MRRWVSILFAMLLSALSLHAGKQIVVDLSKQEAYAYEDGRLLFSGWISTGKPGHRTPTGRYRVLEKDIDHVSSRYPEPNGGAEMHYMLRVTGYGVAMHLGYVPNYPASHGCIRMENGFAQKMYYWADVGTPILIKGTPPRRVDRPISRNAPRVARASGSGSAGGVLGNDPLKFLSSVPARRQALAAADAKKKKKKNRAARSRSVETPGSNDPLVFLSSVPAKRQALAAAEAKKQRKRVAARKKRRQREMVENQKPLTPLEALKG